MLTVYSGLPSLSDPDMSQYLYGTKKYDVLGDVVQDFSDTSSDDDALSIRSQDSHEKVCDENWTGELMRLSPWSENWLAEILFEAPALCNSLLMAISSSNANVCLFVNLCRSLGDQ